MKVLYICGKPPSDLIGMAGGTSRMARVTVAGLMKHGARVTWTNRLNTTTLDQILQKRKEYDIFHCDDTSTLQKILALGIVPDVVGPNVRSPFKQYPSGEPWVEYPCYREHPEQLYDDMLWIRNNFAEEPHGQLDLRGKIRIVEPGIETQEIIPPENKKELHVLWAGMAERPVKNFDLAMRVEKATILPDGFYFKFLTSPYTMKEFLAALNEAVVFFCTSIQESFCFTLFEAWCKAVPTVYPLLVWGEDFSHRYCGGYTLDADEYNPIGYARNISAILNLPPDNRAAIGKQSRGLVIERGYTVEGYGKRLLEAYKQCPRMRQSS